MLPTWLPAWILIATVAAGCLAPAPLQGAPNPPMPLAQPLTSFEVHMVDGARRVSLRTLEAGVLTVHAANQYNFDAAPPVMEACGAARVVTAERSMGMMWAESHGRALLVAKDGAPTVVESPLAPESTWLPIDFNGTEEWPVEAGTVVTLEVALQASAPEIYSPVVQVEGAPFEVIQDLDPVFTCGANLVPFEGTFVASGLYPALVTAVSEAQHSFTTSLGTQATWVMVSRLGACNLGIDVDGATVAEAQGVLACGASATSGPGEVTFWASTTVGYNVAWAYVLWDVPALTES